MYRPQQAALEQTNNLSWALADKSVIGTSGLSTLIFDSLQSSSFVGIANLFQRILILIHLHLTTQSL